MPWLALLACALLACAAGGCTSSDDLGSDARDIGAGRGAPDGGAGICEPSFDGIAPAYVLEGDTLAVGVRCASGLTLTGAAFEIDALPDGAEYDPAAAVLTWTPGLDQAGVYTLTVRVPKLDEHAAVEIGVVDRWDDPDNAPVDPFAYTNEYGLPVLHLVTSDGIGAEAHSPATLVYQGREYPGVQAKYRGQTSLTYPKKSFTVKLAADALLSDEPRGLHDEHRIVLTTTFDDSSYLRQRLAYELWNRLSPDHIQIAAFNAVLYLNGRYHGLYLVSDHVDEDLMDDHGLWEGGNLYKARGHQANFRLEDDAGETKSSLHLGYTKEEGAPPEGEPGAYDDLDALVDWIATAADDDFRDQLGEHVVQREFEDWWIFVSLIEAGDSAGKNSYLYHDPRPDSPAPLWRYVPWDFNHSFGQSWRTWRIEPTEPPERYQRWNGLFERMLAEPHIREPLLARYRAALHDVYAVDEVIELVDAWTAEIDAAALRDEQKWIDAFRAYEWERDDLTTYSEEIEYLRTWIRKRWSVVDGAL